MRRFPALFSLARSWSFTRSEMHCDGVLQPGEGTVDASFEPDGDGDVERARLDCANRSSTRTATAR